MFAWSGKAVGPICKQTLSPTTESSRSERGCGNTVEEGAAVSVQYFEESMFQTLEHETHEKLWETVPKCGEEKRNTQKILNIF